MSLYEEPCEAGSPHRAVILKQMKRLVTRERRKASARRARYFRPDFSSAEAYAESIVPYRKELKSMLGWPLTEYRPEESPNCRESLVAEDDLGRIYRLWIETLPGFETYGILFIPRGKAPFPLVISQHGGGGTPELCSGFFDYGNYNDMTRRVLRRGMAAFAPQLLLWREDFGPPNERQQIDVGKKDRLFAVRHARPEARKAAAIFENLGIPEHFCYKENEGAHELDKDPDPMDFLARRLTA